MAGRASPREAFGRRALAAAAALLALASLAACDQLGDPREGLFRHVDKPVPGTEQPYPNLASVPDKPAVTPEKERAAIRQQLSRDVKGGSAPPLDPGATPTIPAAPPPLPQSFLSAREPTKLAGPPPAELGAAAAAQGAGAATLPASGPSFGALGSPRKVAVVLFDAGSSQLDPAQLGRLRPIVRELHDHGGTLQVVGHAARAEDGGEGGARKLAAFDLSLDRANAVARALIEVGAKSSEVIVSAEGDSASAPSAGGVSGPAADRRADVYLED
jgi:outer membrane protein OmpA-like peptidoglycan-associated protein